MRCSAEMKAVVAGLFMLVDDVVHVGGKWDQPGQRPGVIFIPVNCS